MVSNTPWVYIDPPVAEPYRHGLFDAAPVLSQPDTDDGVHWQYGCIEFESLMTYMSATYPGGLNDVNGAGGVKVLPACAGVVRASAFAIYGGVQAGSLGHTAAEWTARARSIVELSGQHAVESALWTGTAGAAPAFNAAATPYVLPAQSANTAMNAVDMVTGIAMAEAYLQQRYAGRGIIHAPRQAAAYLEYLQQIKRQEDRPEQLTTKLGNRFAFGAGYDGTGPGAAAPPAATLSNQYMWMYVTGAVMVLSLIHI